MRALDLAIFFMLFNIGIGMMNFMVVDPSMGSDFKAMDNPATHKMFTQVSLGNITGMQSDVNNTANQLSSVSDPGIWGWFGAMWNGFFKVIGIMMSLFSGMLSGTKTLCDIFGIPGGIGDLLQGVVYLIYVIGLVQWLSGRGTKEAT